MPAPTAGAAVDRRRKRNRRCVIRDRLGEQRRVLQRDALQAVLAVCLVPPQFPSNQFGLVAVGPKGEDLCQVFLGLLGISPRIRDTPIAAVDAGQHPVGSQGRF